MLGGVVNVFPYFQPTSVALFAQDTHNPAFSNQPVRNWIGGWEFTREPDFLSFFQNIAVAAGLPGRGLHRRQQQCDRLQLSEQLHLRPAAASPRPIQIFRTSSSDQTGAATSGPTSRIATSGSWRSRTPMSSPTRSCSQYNSDVVAGQDDGNFPGGAFGYELPIKYTADSFTQYN